MLLSALCTPAVVNTYLTCKGSLNCLPRFLLWRHNDAGSIDGCDFSIQQSSVLYHGSREVDICLITYVTFVLDALILHVRCLVMKDKVVRTDGIGHSNGKPLQGRDIQTSCGLCSVSKWYNSGYLPHVQSKTHPGLLSYRSWVSCDQPRMHTLPVH